MTNTNNKPSPIEVWLRQRNIQVTCTVVREDETTYELDVDSLSMRGAQREITGWFLNEGYVAVGRWESDGDDPAMQAREAVRRFKLASSQ